MAQEPIFKTVKGRITAILVGTIVTAGIVGGVILFQDKLFRTIVAQEIKSTFNCDTSGNPQ